MKRDLRSDLETMTRQLEHIVLDYEDCAPDELIDELDDLVAALKHTIDFTLAKAEPVALPVVTARLLYCKVCGVSCVRRNEPPIRCPAGHPLTFD
jgi:hypothetical protein